jgi:hypothetical protein
MGLPPPPKGQLGLDPTSFMILIRPSYLIDFLIF